MKYKDWANDSLAVTGRTSVVSVLVYATTRQPLSYSLEKHDQSQTNWPYIMHRCCSI